MSLATYSAPIDLSEIQLKAAFVYNFAKFAEWPSSIFVDKHELKLCLSGSGSINEALRLYADKKISENSLHIISLNNVEKDLTSCHLLFINKTEKDKLLSILKSIENLPILTVSDMDDFAEKGGGIGLVWNVNKLGFEVNLVSIKNANIRLPSQLVNIASHVYGR